MSDAEAHGHGCCCGAGVRSERSARGIDRRHRRQSQDGSRLTGHPLVPSAALARGKGSETARAIMTTDPFPKEYAVTVQTGARDRSRVGGTAKGSGMIEPNMATMLGFLTTDASVGPALLDRALRESGTRYVQRHHRRRRVLDERLVVRPGVRRERCHGRRGARTLRSSKRFCRVERARARYRARWRGRDEADQRSTFATHGPRRGAPGCAHDRQLSAGEDRGSRRGPELGPHRRGCRTRRCEVRRAARHRARGQRFCSSRMGCRMTMQRRARRST